MGGERVVCVSLRERILGGSRANVHGWSGGGVVCVCACACLVCVCACIRCRAASVCAIWC